MDKASDIVKKAVVVDTRGAHSSATAFELAVPKKEKRVLVQQCSDRTIVEKELVV